MFSPSVLPPCPLISLLAISSPSIFPLSVVFPFLSSVHLSDYFTELHGRSERSLQEALSPLGPLYSQNTRLYGDLYTDLRQYYRGSALNLDETLSEFWSRLLERTFKISAPTEVSKEPILNETGVRIIPKVFCMEILEI